MYIFHVVTLEVSFTYCNLLTSYLMEDQMLLHQIGNKGRMSAPNTSIPTVLQLRAIAI